ncbi:hypothetical protein [Aquipuribacter hungaricus]|uniref:Bulb-type lectin domain-containing protein n=1 Tax=Aquipuribacter hungaricus TaxID=545624 RepID=A0ABV7WBG5_9MICO
MSATVPLRVPARPAALLACLLLVLAALLAPATGARAAVPPGLGAGSVLQGGQQVVSGSYRLVMQTDGNLVVHAAGGRVRWHAGTHGNAGARTVMQGDGNLVVYSASGRPLWDSRSAGNPGARTVLQPDGNLVVYRADGRPLWHIGADTGVTVADPSGLYGIRGGVARAACGDPVALASAMAASRSLFHGGTGWNGQIVAVGGDAPALVRAWQESPPHATVASGTWSRMWAGAARGPDGRLYGVVNFCR